MAIHHFATSKNCYITKIEKVLSKSTMISAEEQNKRIHYPASQWKIDPSKLPLTKYSSWNGCQASAGNGKKPCVSKTNKLWRKNRSGTN